MLPLMLLLWACPDSADIREPDPEPKPCRRAVLVYMIADNNLSGNAVDDLEEMKQGMIAGKYNPDGRLLVYYSGPDHNPRLIEIDNTGKSVTLTTYPQSLSGVSIEGMRRAVTDAARAIGSSPLGIVFWSHGTGWLHDSGTLDENATASAMRPYSFGWDGPQEKKMKISSMAAALDGRRYDFIYFDCCHMGTVEVAYELRHLTDRIIASPTELGVSGMPYDRNLGPLFAASADLEKAVSNTFSFYSIRFGVPNDPDQWGCSISLIDASKIEALADLTAEVLRSAPDLRPDSYRPVPCFRTVVMSTGIFDMSDYISAICPDPQLLSRWRQAYRDVVVRHYSTPQVFNLSAEKFTGLGCHIVRTPDESQTYGYNHTAWYSDVVSHALNPDNQ